MSAKDRNKRIAEEHGCILCGRHDGIDPAHYPIRRSQGAGWGLLEFIPLCHGTHYRLDNNLLEPYELQVLDSCAMLYYKKVLRAHRDDASVYLGPDRRIREVEIG